MQEHKTNKEIQKLFFSIVLQYVIYYFGVRLKVGPIAISGMLLVRVIDIYCRECGSFYGPPSLIMTNGICNSVHTRDTYSDLVKQKKKTDRLLYLLVYLAIYSHTCTVTLQALYHSLGMLIFLAKNLGF